MEQLSRAWPAGLACRLFAVSTFALRLVRISLLKLMRHSLEGAGLFLGGLVALALKYWRRSADKG